MAGKRTGRLLLVTLCCLSIALAPIAGLRVQAATVESNTVVYMDMTRSWAQPEVKQLTAAGVLSGKENYRFCPEDMITRAEAAKIFYMLSGLAGKSTYVGGGTMFTDVAPESWYKKYIYWASQKGLIAGLSATEFAPEKGITREHFALAAANFFDYCGGTLGSGSAATFADDSEISKSTKAAVYRMRVADIFMGDENNEFCPQDTASRQEACAIFSRLAKKLSIALSSKYSIRLLDPKKPMVALTFDDGPKGNPTVQIAAKLEEYGARGTFFMLGLMIPGREAEVRRLAESGHEIANHTYGHKQLNALSAKEIKNQVEATNNALISAIGKGASLVRPPYGAANNTVKKNVRYPMINWSIDPEDWRYQNASRIASNVLKDVKDGDIILLHDIYQSTADACNTLIPELAARGYQMVTVPELFAAKGMKLEAGELYRHA